MPRILHLIDDDDPFELRMALRPVLERLSPGRCSQFAAALSGGKPAIDLNPAVLVARFPDRFGTQLLNLPALRQCVLDHGIDLIHAWSLKGACMAAMSLNPEFPIALTCWDPVVHLEDRPQWAAVRAHQRVGLLCHTARVQRRVIEHGTDPACCTIVRPGIDFAAINRFRQSAGLRDELRIEAHHRVILLPPAPAHGSGNLLDGVWAVEMATRLMPELLVLLPGTSPEQARIARYLRSVPNEAVVHMTGQAYPFEQLLAAADLVLQPATDEVPTTPLTWAMAAGVPILACATYAVAEFLADGHNGHLIKPGSRIQLAGKIIDVLRRRGEFRGAHDLARAQAFESFGLTRYRSQVQQVWENLLASRPVGENLVDSALDIRPETTVPHRQDST